jgi:hypothetical protein
MANKKDYHIIAKTLSKAIKEDSRTEFEKDVIMKIARNLADKFKEDNQKFDRRKFMNTVVTDYQYLE